MFYVLAPYSPQYSPDLIKPAISYINCSNKNRGKTADNSELLKEVQWLKIKMSRGTKIV